MDTAVIIVAIIAGSILAYRLIEGFWPQEPTTLDEMDVIDNELARLHLELKAFVGGTHQSQAYQLVVAEVSRLNTSLAAVALENAKQMNEALKEQSSGQ